LKENINRSADHAVVIVNKVRAEQPIIQVIFPARAQVSSFLLNFRPKGWPTHTPIKFILKAVSPRVKRGIEGDRSFLPSAEGTNEWSY
jgi:hypothetical protein